MSSSRINNPQSCFVCARHSSGMAAGIPPLRWPGGRLGWYCGECGPALARKALTMKRTEMDSLEIQTCVLVAAECGEDNLVIKRDELPAFVSWCVQRFSEVMRQSVEDGEAPF
jgi:hypothetical protein